MGHVEMANEEVCVVIILSIFFFFFFMTSKSYNSPLGFL